MAVDDGRAFDRAARSAGILTAGRQIGAVVFTGAVMLLPRYASRHDVDVFVWAYFAQLLVSSILNLGLERFTSRGVAGGHNRADRAPILGAGLRGRVVTAPLTPLALAALLGFVHVGLPLGGWLALTAWTLAVQVQGVLFAALRSAGLVSTEAGIAFGGRLAQTILLIAAATAGWGVVPLLSVVMAVDLAVMAVAWLRSAVAVGVCAGGRLPYRTLAVYTGIEVLVFTYLRTDLIIVGRILGANRGATYGLAYRFVDALVALSTPALLVLFSHASSEMARGVDLAVTRRRAQAMLPPVGVVLAAVAIVGVGPLAAFVPRLAPAAPALRVLLATVPLTYLIGAEALLLSAEDRNRPVLAVAAVSLTASVVLNLVLVPHFGMLGAAAALVATELGQAAGLAFGARARGARASLQALAAPVVLLLTGAIALNMHVAGVGVVLLVASALTAARRFRAGLDRRPVAVLA